MRHPSTSLKGSFVVLVDMSSIYRSFRSWCLHLDIKRHLEIGMGKIIWRDESVKYRGGQDRGGDLNRILVCTKSWIRWVNRWCNGFRIAAAWIDIYQYLLVLNPSVQSRRPQFKASVMRGVRGLRSPSCEASVLGGVIMTFCQQNSCLWGGSSVSRSRELGYWVGWLSISEWR